MRIGEDGKLTLTGEESAELGEYLNYDSDTSWTTLKRWWIYAEQLAGVERRFFWKSVDFIHYDHNDRPMLYDRTGKRKAC